MPCPVAGPSGPHRITRERRLTQDNHINNPDDERRGSVKFEVQGLEVLAKQVKQSGNSGRIYLPPNWVGKKVKIIRLD